MRAIHEDDFVADFEPQAEGSEKGFDSPSGIERGIHVARPKVIHTTRKGVKRGRRGSNRKFVNLPFTVTNTRTGPECLKLWTEQAVKHPNVGVLGGYCPSRGIGKALGEHAIEVVGHFRFDLNVACNVKSGSAAEPDCKNSYRSRPILK